MNQADYGRHRGVSRMQVSHWKKSGLLVFLGDGSVDAEASDARLAGHGVKVKRPVKPATSVKTASAEDGESPEEAAKRLTETLGANFNSKADAEKVKETYLALLRKLEFDEKSGEVVRIASVVKRVGEEYSRVRSRLMSIPADVAPTIAAMRTAEEVRDCLEREITEALMELSSDDGRANS